MVKPSYEDVNILSFFHFIKTVVAHGHIFPAF